MLTFTGPAGPDALEGAGAEVRGEGAGVEYEGLGGDGAELTEGRVRLQNRVSKACRNMKISQSAALSRKRFKWFE